MSTIRLKGLNFKLKAVGYPAYATFDATEDSEFRNAVVYLENQIIRFYKINERTGLQKSDDPQWENAYKKYLEDMKCPVKDLPKMSQLDWLLGRATSYQYISSKDKLNQLSAEQYASQRDNKLDVAFDPLEDVNYESDGFKSFVQRLAKTLDIPPHPDHKQVFQAACILVQDRLNKATLDRGIKEHGRQQPVLMTLEEVPLGFEVTDQVSRDLAAIIRLLHVRNLRDLQNDINATIVAVQALTADPKTDEKLGKVGY